jgi:hypothetical protein
MECAQCALYNYAPLIASAQEKVRRAAPSGWDLDLVDMNMGNDGPRMANYQV